MPFRFVLSLLAALALATPAAAHAQAPAAAPQMAQLLFVQGAAGVELGGGGSTLTLKGLSPTTLFFSDRPVSTAGHYRTEEYLQFWKNGPDSFLKDPPNATLSVFEKSKDELADVVVTLRNPRLSGNDHLRRHRDLGNDSEGGRAGVALHRHHRAAVHALVRRRRAAHRYRTVFGAARASNAAAASATIIRRHASTRRRSGDLPGAGPTVRHRDPAPPPRPP
jgi:hypothetical protein